MATKYKSSGAGNFILLQYIAVIVFYSYFKYSTSFY